MNLATKKDLDAYLEKNFYEGKTLSRAVLTRTHPDLVARVCDQTDYMYKELPTTSYVDYALAEFEAIEELTPEQLGEYYILPQVLKLAYKSEARDAIQGDGRRAVSWLRVGWPIPDKEDEFYKRPYEMAGRVIAAIDVADKLLLKLGVVAITDGAKITNDYQRGGFKPQISVEWRIWPLAA
jgi:hypothetical protein